MPLNIFMGPFIKSIINVFLPVACPCLTAGATYEKKQVHYKSSTWKEKLIHYILIIYSQESQNANPLFLQNAKKTAREFQQKPARGLLNQ